MAHDCIFCKIGSGAIESDILYRDDNCFVIRDITPKAPVHLLVIPNRHFTYLKSLTPDDHSMIGGMFQAAKDAARVEGLGENGYRLVINQGSDSGQEVPHLHLHLLGGRRLRGMA
jgi:histidine triad (HIT) family protein